MPHKPPLIKRPAHCPKKEIDWSEVDQYVQAGCSGVEIAAVFNVIPETFYARYEQEHGSSFSTRRSERWGVGKAKVKMRQLKSALDGNTVMLKLLGEEWLSQGRKDQIDSLDLIDVTNKVIEGEVSQI